MSQEESEGVDAQAIVEKALLNEAAQAQVLELKKDQMSIANLLVRPEFEDTLSALRRKDPEMYARLRYYLALRDAAYAMDAKAGRFIFPDPSDAIEARALTLKRSVGARIVEALKSITHIAEGSQPQRRGFLGGRR